MKTGPGHRLLDLFAGQLAVVIRHFRDSADYLMPVHVVQGAEEVDHERRRRARLDAMAELEEAAPVRELRDRRPEVNELIRRLRDSLPAVDPVKFRRAEVLAWERERRIAQQAEPNPHYDPTLVTAQEAS